MPTPEPTQASPTEDPVITRIMTDLLGSIASCPEGDIQKLLINTKERHGPLSPKQNEALTTAIFQALAKADYQRSQRSAQNAPGAI